MRRWRERVVRHDFGDVTAIFLDVNDRAISKYVRGAENDFRWIEAGYEAGILDINTIRARAEWGTDFYPDEKRPTLSRIRMHTIAMGLDGKLSTNLLAHMHARGETSVVDLDPHAGEYVGRIEWADDKHAVQNLGRERVAIHAIADWQQKPLAGQSVTIRYADHQPSLVLQNSIRRRITGL